MVNRFFVTAVCILGLLPIHTSAQQSLGINWEQVPEQQSAAEQQLRHFSGMGFSYLQVHEPLQQDTWEVIEELNFTVFGMLPVKFPVSSPFAAQDSTASQHIQELLQQYNKQSAVKAIGVFAYGNWQDANFRLAASDFTEKIRNQTAKETYYQTTQQQSWSDDFPIDFKLLSQSQLPASTHDTTRAFLYRPEVDDYHRPAPAKELLEQNASSAGTVLFFNSIWFLKLQQVYPNIGEVMQLYATTEDAAFPLPQQTVQPLRSNTLVVIMLIIAWIILAAAYSYNPVYRRSLIRYYSAHSFYVKDVMERHIRSMFAGSSILLQHAITGGIVLYCICSVAFTPLGLQAFLYHYPIVGSLGATTMGMFLMGFFLTMVVELLMVMWLWITSSSNIYLSQIINLYPWSLQFNLLLGTLTLGLYLAGSHNVAIYLIAILFLIIFLGSFNITVFDIARHIKSKRMWYLAGTIGIYGVIFIAAVVWIILSNNLQQVLNLSASLP